MSVEDNKRLVLQAMDAISALDVDALMATVAEDGTWTVPYRTDQFHSGGTMDKAGTRQFMSNSFSGFTDWSFQVTSVTAEEDRVAVQAKAAGSGPGTATYQNVYHFAFTVKDGAIASAREFFDPFEVLAYLQQWPKD